MTEMTAQPSPTMELVLSELRKDPENSFADVRDRAAARGLKIYPIIYGRAKALLGLVPTARRGEGKQARATAARKAAQRERARGETAGPTAPAREPRRGGPPLLPTKSRPQPSDRLEDMVSQFRRIAEERDRYGDALERMQRLVHEALS